MNKLIPLLFVGLVVLAAPQAERSGASVQIATGVVFNDLNGNGIRDPGEQGIAGVRVSNQIEIVRTDSQGRWQLPVTDDITFFVIKPRGWMTPVNEHNLPQFYYVHKPEGSPNMRYPGVAPTGPLPASIEFPLRPQREPDKFRAVFFGDTQPRNQREVDYIAKDVIPELIGIDAAFGVTLGDVVFDDLTIFEPMNAAIALIGIPWYNVIGNHDINFDAPNDALKHETWKRVYGPNYYSFEYGPAYFIVLDDVRWSGSTPERSGRYHGGIGADQLEYVRKDLSMIPEDKLVVLMMHIPLVDVEDRRELYRLIEKRPYALSVSGHTHYQEHRFITKEDGWEGPEPHHHVINVTVCGSWWQGAPDEMGIPHTTMRDGAPNGYSIFTFDGSSYSIEFKAARRSEAYQINIIAPDEVDVAEAGQTLIHANVFGGSERSKVDFRVGPGSEWRPMRRALKPDPWYVSLFERDRGLTAPFRPLPAPVVSTHLWEALLPEDVPLGVQPIYVRSTDMFGKTHTQVRAIRIR